MQKSLAKPVQIPAVAVSATALPSAVPKPAEEPPKPLVEPVPSPVTKSSEEVKREEVPPKPERRFDYNEAVALLKKEEQLITQFRSEIKREEETLAAKLHGKQ